MLSVFFCKTLLTLFSVHRKKYFLYVVLCCVVAFFLFDQAKNIAKMCQEKAYYYVLKLKF